MLLLVYPHLGDSWESAREGLTSRLLCFTTGFPGAPKGSPLQLFSLCSNLCIGAVILSFIEQGRIDRGGRAILEAFLVKISQDGFAFRGRQGASRPRPRSSLAPGRTRTSIPVVGPAGYPQGKTSGAGADCGGEFSDCGHQDSFSGSSSGSG